MPPNILFLLVDCLRADRVAAGQTFARTPCLSRLRASGATFTQAISAASTTTPCTATILSGLYPARHGIRSHSGYKLNPGIVTLPQLLAQTGYHTWAEPTGPLGPESGLDRGYQDYRFRQRLTYLDGQWGAELRRRLPQLPQPWFGFVHLWELHVPRRAARAFDRPEYGATLYDRALSALDGQIQRLLEAAPPDTIVVVHGDHGETIGSSITIERRRSQKQILLNALPMPVRLAGRRLLNLVAPKRRQNRSAPRNKRLESIGHGYHVYDFLVRVPLVLAGPGLPAGLAVPDQVRQVDIAPTLADLVGLAWPNPIDGRSLAPLIRGGSLPALPALSEACGIVLVDPKWWRSSIRTGKYKYVYGPNNPDLPEELYDLEADPQEMNSLAEQQPELAAQLRAQLQRAAQGGLEAGAEQTMSDDEMAIVEKRLRDLGYLE